MFTLYGWQEKCLETAKLKFLLYLRNKSQLNEEGIIMAKLPKFSELTDVSAGLMNKFKSALDSITGPGSSELTREALAQESDPTKAKLLEIELLINQIYDMQVLQNKAINTLQSKYAEIKTLAGNALSCTQTETKAPQVESEPKTKSKAQSQSEVNGQPKE